MATKQQQIDCSESYSFAASYTQQRMWLLHRLEPVGSAYNIPVAFRLRGALDPSGLAGALNGSQVPTLHGSLQIQ